VAVEHARAPHFVAVGARFRAAGGEIGLNDAARAALGVQPGDDVAYVTT
jgi:hypothetical protein